MKQYNASKKPVPELWLSLDDDTRLELVEKYVENFERKIDDSAKSIHASIHMVVENQLALNEDVTIKAYQRLMQQGLKRHETIHAIGAIILESIESGMKEKSDEPIVNYKNRLRKLTAKRWIKGKY